ERPEARKILSEHDHLVPHFLFLPLTCRKIVEHGVAEYVRQSVLRVDAFDRFCNDRGNLDLVIKLENVGRALYGRAMRHQRLRKLDEAARKIKMDAGGALLGPVAEAFVLMPAEVSPGADHRTGRLHRNEPLRVTFRGGPGGITPAHC